MFVGGLLEDFPLVSLTSFRETHYRRKLDLLFLSPSEALVKDLYSSTGVCLPFCKLPALVYLFELICCYLAVFCNTQELLERCYLLLDQSHLDESTSR